MTGGGLVCHGPLHVQALGRSPPRCSACSPEAGFQFLWVLLHLGDHSIGGWVWWDGPCRGLPVGDGAGAPLPRGPRAVSFRGCACSESHRALSPVPQADSPHRAAHVPLLGSLVLPASRPARGGGPAAGPTVVSPWCPVNSDVSLKMSFFTLLLKGCSC